jgi:hypothetical protein
MTPEEMKERTIGLLTAAYTAARESQPDIADTIAELAGSLIEGIDAYKCGLHVAADQDVSKLLQAAADHAAGQVAAEASRRIAAMASTLLVAFVEVSRRYEAACPDADILRVLQDVAALDPINFG